MATSMIWSVSESMALGGLNIFRHRPGGGLISIVLLSLASAAAYGLAAVLQHYAAVREPPELSIRAGLLVRLVKRPMWLVGSTLDGAGYLFQFLALRRGSLTLVEPLLVLSLVFALPVAAWLDHRRISRSEIPLIARRCGGVGVVPHRCSARCRTSPSIGSGLGLVDGGDRGCLRVDGTGGEGPFQHTGGRDARGGFRHRVRVCSGGDGAHRPSPEQRRCAYVGDMGSLRVVGRRFGCATAHSECLSSRCLTPLASDIDDRSTTCCHCHWALPLWRAHRFRGSRSGARGARTGARLGWGFCPGTVGRSRSASRLGVRIAPRCCECRPLGRCDVDNDSMGAKPQGSRTRRSKCPPWVIESVCRQ